VAQGGSEAAERRRPSSSGSWERSPNSAPCHAPGLGRTAPGRALWGGCSLPRAFSVCFYPAPSPPVRRSAMSAGGDFGNPLRKFKLVFLGEQS
ncbi:hypothetical protein NDU88_008504, partial [Pleurodeles waltl]